MRVPDLLLLFALPNTCSCCIDDDDYYYAQAPDGLLPQRLLQGIEHGQVVGEDEEPDLGFKIRERKDETSARHARL